MIKLLLFIFGISPSFGQIEFYSAFGESFEAFCPKRQFVSFVEIQKQTRRRVVVKDIRFRIHCESFVSNDEKDDVSL